MNTLIGKPLPRKVGYTHTIKWKEKHPMFGEVSKSMPTTRDAVNLHIRQMEVGKMCYDIKVVPYEGTKF